jgi:hydroxyethylthiazole kinase-like uncharacterized protein yjeF
MQVVLSREQMKRADERAIRSYGIPGLVLMENAGAGIAQALASAYAPLQGKTVLVVAGKGNNGGDGFVVARHLLSAGARVHILLVVPPTAYTGDALINYKIVKAFARDGGEPLTIGRASPKALQALEAPDLIVDAIFGTGFSGKVGAPLRRVIEWINRQRVPVVAIDIPSGVDGSTGVVANIAVRAERTITMAAPKIGLLCSSGREHSGAVHVVDIGMPRAILDDRRHSTFLIGPEDVRRILPQRSLHAHKYSVGKVFLLAGARGYTGAAVLSALGALKSGAGAVHLGVPEAVYPIIAKKVTEPVIVSLPSTAGGSLALEARDRILERMAWADVVVVGPGLSRHDEVMRLLAELFRQGHKRMLIDADGLFLLARLGLKTLRRNGCATILTPHAGEFAELSGLSAREIEANRVEASRSFARKHHVGLLLKGAPTATAMPDGTVVLNSSGNPGLATVGSGDVLSGLVAGLWAQGCAPLEAASSAAYLHGRAGDLAARKLGQRSLMAGDLIEFLPFTFQELER